MSGAHEGTVWASQVLARPLVDGRVSWGSFIALTDSGLSAP
jgi:hypothetical protein